MDRRHFAKSAVAGLVLLGSGRAFAQDTSGDEFDGLEPAFLDEIDALNETGTRAQITVLGDKIDFSKIPDVADQIIRSQVVAEAQNGKKAYAQLPEALLPKWPAVDKAPDYFYMAGYKPSAPEFRLTGALLDQLAENNSFKLPGTPGGPADFMPIVPFGLRGCEIADQSPMKPFAAEQALRVVEPSHRETRCVMGVWDRARNQISVYRASTLPSGIEAFMALRAGGYGASLLPTGLYDYKVGVHNARKAGRGADQPGALVHLGDYIVLRTAKDLVFDPYAATTGWTHGAAHNVHSSGTSHSLQNFDSAGCQVVCGWYSGQYDQRAAIGNWAQFQRDAGLASAAGKPLSSGPKYKYLLLTGLEAALYQQSADFQDYYKQLGLLRPGSSGHQVASRKTRLLKRDTVSNVFDAETTIAVLEQYKASPKYNEYASHIYTRNLDQ